jgi:hypothetical protein
VYVIIENYDLGMGNYEIVDYRNSLEQKMTLNVGKKGNHLISNIMLRPDSSYLNYIVDDSVLIS